MSLRIRMILANQFDHLVNELEEASEELSLEDNNEIKSINADIIIAKNRVIEFKAKAIKEFEKLQQQKLKKLKTKKRLRNKFL